MKYNKLPSRDLEWSSIGYGMWGLAGWSGNDDDQNFDSLCLAVENGVNFFDTAWAYGAGKSEEILGKLIKNFPHNKIYAASKIPPMNQKWPALNSYSIDEVFPKSHILEFTKKSIKNLGLTKIDLMQFHVWNDNWANSDIWKEAVNELKSEGLVDTFGISVNRFEPNNVLKTLETGLIDCVQVVYNLFDQNPEDQLFPYCQKNNIGIIARVPFDEGSLTGTLQADSTFPDGDWRNLYFNKANLSATLPRVESIKKELPDGMSLSELALKFILHHPAVTTVIPGMRQKRNVLANLKAGDGVKLSNEVYQTLKKYRWERTSAQNATP
jgi:aryl-alcohol dehydrogenase-like predicted oxidoreductase